MIPRPSPATAQTLHQIGGKYTYRSTTPRARLPASDILRGSFPKSRLKCALRQIVVQSPKWKEFLVVEILSKVKRKERYKQTLLLSHLAWANVVLPDFVKQRLVANVQFDSGALAVPRSLFEYLRDDFHFRAILQAAHHFFQIRLRLWRALGDRRGGAVMHIECASPLQFRDGDGLIAQDQEALYEVLQFANIAGPVIVLACFHQPRRDVQRGAGVAVSKADHEMTQHHGNFFAALAQRWHAQNKEI